MTSYPWLLLTVTKACNIVRRYVSIVWCVVGVGLEVYPEWFEIMKKQCDRCSGKFFRRLNRKGFMERTVLPHLGFFPWECALCRRKVVLRTDGFKPSTKATTASVPAAPLGALASSLAFAGRKHRQ